MVVDNEGKVVRHFAFFSAKLRCPAAFGLAYNSGMPKPRVVFATALRKVGEAGAAQEVAQNVFTALARKAWQFSPEDSLIKMSKWLFRSKNRVGGLSPADFPLKSRARIASLGTVDFVYCDVSGYSTSHDYEFAHPAVVSDLIKVLRENASAGAEHGRPLKSPAEAGWPGWLKRPAWVKVAAGPACLVP